MATQWIDPVYDRTQADVDRVRDLNNIGYFNMTPEQKQEWLQDSKGALNESDLVRIENNVQLLSDVLELDLDTYDENIPEIPKVSYYDNLAYNIATIRAQGYWHIDTPEAPTVPLNQFEKINAIEQILSDAYRILNNNFYQFCATVSEGVEYTGIYAGEGIGLLL